ncbi:DEAD/DEAH box helicase [Clostridium botulinum]|uniref:SNF2-related protein n=1 Tax=Clostridium botulinum TaxID=1491 RepID=UPI00059703BE|nr:SNF2-related protein [Clostridium botulinum]KIL09239.1 DEAD/DEAH box helicase [Clostridium botulinum]MBY6932938.1 DEAD/DEAH box helicase family protein [Clostridium botulinum]NFL82268.1 DEAD/DEAH box helicase [Clostridium botulinum]NFN10781.1 DEAD/DEAH box helicase [Clostridium botulinum]NFO36086.1 DEAD/DEAH box helicase [Clostridium botulinum]
MKFKPWNYQQYAINHILEHQASGLFLDMGMGKTVSSLTAIDNLLFLGETIKVLVIAPKRVAEDTWSTEIEKWNHLKNLRISTILGTPKQRTEAVEKDADIYVTNRENVVWLVDNYFKSWKWDTCIIDELSSFKSSKAKRFRALKKVRPYFKRIIGLTGTPAPNSLIDLWPQVYLLDGGQRLGKTITGYRERYFTPGDRNQFVVFNYNLKDGAEYAIHNKISDICVSMKAKDYLDLPERIDNKIYIDLPKNVKDQYKELEKDLIIQLDNEDITATNSAVLTGKLLQMCNGAIYSEDKEIVEVHDEKLNALMDIIDAANGKPVLVFYSFKHDLIRIQEFLKKNKLKGQELDGPEDIKKWNNWQIPILLLHPASAGHGLNLQYGGNIVVWFGLTWSLELYQQANARLHRQGQKETVIIHHIIARDTVDEDVIKALTNKEVNQNVLLEAVKARCIQCEQK